MITITLNKYISFNHISVFHVEEDISDHSRQTSFHHIFTKYLSNHIYNMKCHNTLSLLSLLKKHQRVLVCA